MDDQKRDFLFGELPDGADADDPDEWAELFSLDSPQQAPVHLAVRQAVASQIANDDPPGVWQHASRLLSEGRERQDVLRQLMICLTPHLVRAVEGEGAFDEQDYLASLAALPLPSVDELEGAVLEVARTRSGLSFAELVPEVTRRVGSRVDDPAVEALLDLVVDELMDHDGPLVVLAPDQVVHVEAVVEGIVLTHRLTAGERASAVLPLTVDLAGFSRLEARSLSDGRAINLTAEGWEADDSWLEPYAVGAVLALRVRDGVVSCSVLDDTPEVNDSLVALLRASYDTAVEQPWLPVDIEELVLMAVLADETAFATPAAPLEELLGAAGLEIRGEQVAHEQSVWARAELTRRMHRLYDRLGPGVELDAVLRVLEAIHDELDTASARQVLDELDDPAVLEVVTSEILDAGETSDGVQLTELLAGRLLAAAARPAQRAVALWMSSVVEERRGELDVAEEHLRAAVRLDPEWPPAINRLAWYRSDRGDAEGALRLWRSLGLTAGDSDDVRELEALPTTAQRSLGRNDRCWCGSGRKYKQCHLGRPEALPLPERVGWLCRKATGYLERAGGVAASAVFEHVAARATDPEDRDSILEAVQDPLVLDVLLHEGGQFGRFLTDRGALLPEDEALLAAAWLLVDRTVYEVVEVRPGSGVTLKDLRSGEVLDVRERAFSRTVRPGQRICARAVPDGESHQVIGGLFDVAPGRERALLDLLDEGDGLALLSYVADLHRPPVIVGPDGRAIELPDLPPGPRPEAPAVPADVMEALVEGLEQQWCEGPVPALGGVTPIEAAADPTRRDDVVRLIASFPRIDPSSGAFGLRPAALLERLGLPPAP